MRIKEEIKRSGRFWIPSEPEKKVDGTITISDGGNIELEVVTGKLEDSSGTLNTHLKRVVGYIYKDRAIPVTLDDCYYEILSFDSSSKSSSKSLIRVGKVFIGHEYGEGEIPHFNTLSFSIEGIDDWIPITGIQFEVKDKIGSPIISYDQPADLLFNLENGMELRIIWRLSWDHVFFKEAGMCDKRYFQLYSADACELDDFISITHKITEFLCFAINKTVSLDSISATSNDLHEENGNEKTQPKSIKLYFSSWPFSREEPKIKCYRMLFDFMKIKNEAEKKIDKWLKSSEKLADAFRLYFLSRAGTQTYLEENFLILAQGLEACNENRSNNSNLRDSLTEIIEPFKDFFGNNQQRINLIEKIKVTRDYLTHYNPRKKYDSAKGKDLWILCLKMEILFELHFLRLIEFSEEEIKSIVNNCSDFKYKLLSS